MRSLQDPAPLTRRDDAGGSRGVQPPALAIPAVRLHRAILVPDPERAPEASETTVPLSRSRQESQGLESGVGGH